MIILDDELLVLPGMACGVPQPTAIARATVRLAQDFDSAEIVRRLGTVIDEPFPGFAEGADGAWQLAQLTGFCHGALQRQSRIGIAERFRLRRLDPSGDAARFEFALPVALTRQQLARTWQGSAQLVNRAAQGDWEDAIAQSTRSRADELLRPFAEPGMNRFNMIRAAHRLDVPVRPWVERTLLLGTGIHTRAVESTITDQTPALAVKSAKNKHRTAWMLREAGLPGGQNILVDSRAAALQAAQRLGFPVVVKPNDRDRGEGVAADLRDEQAVGAAFDDAAKISRNVLVEKWAPGYTHRLNVRFGQVDRVARKIAGVVGDGVSGLETLVQRQQETPAHRALRQMHGRFLLQLDEEALGLLRQDGRDASYVPAAGEYVRLRRRDNGATGGTNEELDIRDTRAVHPDNIRLAQDATRVLMLDVAGVDIIMEDISKSWLETGALICEVNAQPQIPRLDLIEGLVRDLVGGGAGRIPAQLYVCGGADGAAAARAQALAGSGGFEGVSHAGGLLVQGQRVTGPFANGFLAGRALLMRRDVASAACVMSLPDIVRLGMPLDRWDEVHFEPLESFSAQEAALLPAAHNITQSPAAARWQ